jgi:LuxR family transcriptional regulator, maltose regulon positive regulatory protein
MRRAPTVQLTEYERAALVRWAEHPDGDTRRALRARIVLEAAGERGNSEIARLLGVHPETVARWRQRFVVTRLDGLARGAPRNRAIGAPPSDLVGRVLSITLDDSRDGARPWTTRSLARTLGVNHMTVHRIWRAHGIIPPSRPRQGEPRPTCSRVDVAGIYLHAPAAAIVFAVDLRAAKASGTDAEAGAGRRDADSPVADLLEMLRTLEERVAPLTSTERSSREFLVHLRAVELESPPAAQLNVLFDRPFEHLPRTVRAWLDRHPRFRAYTPEAGQGWSSLVDGWLRRWESGSVDPSSFDSVGTVVDWVRTTSAGLVRGQPVPAWVSSVGTGPALESRQDRTAAANRYRPRTWPNRRRLV